MQACAQQFECLGIVVKTLDKTRCSTRFAMAFMVDSRDHIAVPSKIFCELLVAPAVFGDSVGNHNNGARGPVRLPYLVENIRVCHALEGCLRRFH